MNVLNEIFKGCGDTQNLTGNDFEVYSVLAAGECAIYNGYIVSEYSAKSLSEKLGKASSTIYNRLKALEDAKLISIQKAFGAESKLVLGEVSNGKHVYYISEALCDSKSKVKIPKSEGVNFTVNSSVNPTVNNKATSCKDLYTELESAYYLKFNRSTKIGKYQTGINKLSSQENGDSKRVLEIYKFFLDNFIHYREFRGYPSYPVFIGFYSLISYDYDLSKNNDGVVKLLHSMKHVSQQKLGDKYFEKSTPLELLHETVRTLSGFSGDLQTFLEIYNFYIDSTFSDDLSFIKNAPCIGSFLRYFSVIFKSYLLENNVLSPKNKLQVELSRTSTSDIDIVEKAKSKRDKLKRMAEEAMAATDPYADY